MNPINKTFIHNTAHKRPDPDEGYVEATLVAVQGEEGDKKVIVETKDGKVQPKVCVIDIQIIDREPGHY